MKRRDFNKMLLAAAGGLMAGTTLGCSAETDETEDDKNGGGESSCKGADGCKGENGCPSEDKDK